VSRLVELADVAARLAEFGPLAILVTVTPDATPHVGTVLVSAGATHLDVKVGARTRDHIRANPSVTLTWVRDAVDYQMIVDGVAVVLDDPDEDGLYAVGIDVHGGILHRLVGRRTGPTCRALRASSVDR
jgi:Pyridoxamine 5'-phosphate oxidase